MSAERLQVDAVVRFLRERADALGSMARFSAQSDEELAEYLAKIKILRDCAELLEGDSL